MYYYPGVMDKLAIAQNLLQETATMHIYSYPHFVLESFLGFVVCLVYIYLHLDVTRIGKDTVQIKPYTICYKDSIRGTYSRESVCTSITRIQHEFCQYRRRGGAPVSATSYKSTRSTHSQLTWLLNNGRRSDIFKPLIAERHQRQSLHTHRHLAALTPQEFVRLDREHNNRTRDVNDCLQSLTALYQTVLKAKNSPYNCNNTSAQSTLNAAKEQLQCMKVSTCGQPMRYLETQKLTDSLFDLLEAHVINSSLANPLPFRGDFTTLAYEAGNLSVQSELDERRSTNGGSSISESSMGRSDGAVVDAELRKPFTHNTFEIK